MRSSYLFITFLVFFYGHAYAFEDCRANSEISSLIDSSRCECGNNLENYENLKVDGFHLIAACFYEGSPKDASEGNFYYKGDKLFSGEIKANQIDSGIVFAHQSGDFFLYGAGEIEKLEQLSASDPKCEVPLTAPASLRVKLFSRVTAESCQNGDFPLQYEITAVGKFSCSEQ